MSRAPPSSPRGWRGSALLHLRTFAVDGLIGIYLLRAWHIAGSETGVVDAFLRCAADSR